ncbi:MAG: hypothetical protein KDC05_15660 [Bacteroidales bacterium]|nr:hypothetical protein [Bacteroidales bacterium]
MSEAYKTRDPDAIYLLTFQVVFWLDVFTRKTYRDIFIESLTFCRQHKVRAGIVEKEEDYLYSSARNYCEGMHALMEIDLLI